jgi:hypothetical protein
LGSEFKGWGEVFDLEEGKAGTGRRTASREGYGRETGWAGMQIYIKVKACGREGSGDGSGFSRAWGSGGGIVSSF